VSQTGRQWRVMVYHQALVDEYMEQLRSARPDLTYYPCETRAQIEQHIGDADVLFASTAFPGELLQRAPNLRWIQAMGAGVEKFILSGVVPKGVALTRVRGSFGPRMAEYVLAHMLAVTQDIPHALRLQAAHNWELYYPEVLYEKTLGVAGLGSIGREVARKAAALDMTVYGFDLEIRDHPFLERCYTGGGLQEFLGRLDFLSLCLPLTPETRGLLDRQALSWMKPTAWVINISRGPLIEESALVEALKAGRLGGAVVDVVGEEPLPPDSGLWDVPDLRITPHMSGPSLVSEVMEVFLKNLEALEQGRPLTNAVDLNRGF